MQFGKDDYEAVASAIRAAEQKTSGQIVCVLAHSSSGYVHIPILWAVVLALFFGGARAAIRVMQGKPAATEPMVWPA